MKKNSVKISSNKSFGFLFFVVFVAISLWPLKSQEDLRLWALVLSLIFLVLGIFKSKKKILAHTNNNRFGFIWGIDYS